MIVAAAVCSVLIGLSIAKPSPQAGLCPNGEPWNVIPDTPGNVNSEVRKRNLENCNLYS